MEVTRLANTALSCLDTSNRHAIRLHGQNITHLSELPSSRAAARLARTAISSLAPYPSIIASCGDHFSKKVCSKGNTQITGCKIPSFKLSIPSSKSLQLVSQLLSSTLAATLSFLIPVPSSLAGTYNNLLTELALSSPTRAIEINERSYGEAIQDNPLAVLVGLVAFSLPFVLPKVVKLGDPETFGSVTAREAYEVLALKEENGQLLDIRAKEDIGKDDAPPGFPDLGAFGKKVVHLPYTDEDDYAERVFAEFKDVENSTLFIMDRLDGKSLAVAKLLTRRGCRGAYAIQGGADGYRGWQTLYQRPIDRRNNFSAIDGKAEVTLLNYRICREVMCLVTIFNASEQLSDLPWQPLTNSNSNSLDDVNDLPRGAQADVDVSSAS